jgi:hypothetical protein
MDPRDGEKRTHRDPSSASRGRDRGQPAPITDHLSAPDRDPHQLHKQLVAAQQDVVASLMDLNAIIGSPAPLPRTTRDLKNASTR